jgi:hypothetical protein
MKDRRIGRFWIDRYAIDERPHQVRAMLQDVIVLRAECLAHADAIEYDGIHPSFDAISRGEMVPKYDAEVATNGDASVRSVAWKRRHP